MKIHMHRVVVALMMLSPISALAGSSVGTYAEARKIWEQSKNMDEYQAYTSEFVQFNNHFQIDMKSRCYAAGSGSVHLFLVITRRDGDSYALIDRVLSDVDTTKAICFRKAYTGVRVKAPPSAPFVLQMDIQ